jgi:hypothetical protein
MFLDYLLRLLPGEVPLRLRLMTKSLGRSRTDLLAAMAAVNKSAPPPPYVWSYQMEILKALEEQVKLAIDAEKSAIVLIAGINDRVATAVAAALANGATAAQLAPITQVTEDLKTASEALAAAVAAIPPIPVPE